MASCAGVWGAIGLLASALLAAGAAQAQSASTTLSPYRTGYNGAGLSSLESPVSPAMISATSQYSISDGVNQAGAVGSVITTETSSSPTSGGAGQSSTGVGQTAVSSERAPLAVVESTNQNARGVTTTPTTQTSTSSASTGATTSGTAPSDLVLNGKLNLDGGQ